jgi:DME family drug/metabolite transporter
VNRLTQARLQVLAAALLFSIGGAGIKASALTGWQVASFRSGIAAIAVWLMMPEARRGWTRRVLLVSLSYAATVLLFVLANRLTTSANTIFLQSTAPLYILLLAPRLLREEGRALDLLVIGLIVLGLSFFFIEAEAPLLTAPNPVAGNILAAIAGITWALTIMGLRWIGRAGEGTASAASVVVAGNLLAFLIGLPFALPVEAARPLDWAIVSGLGVVQIGVAYLFLTRALRYVPALDASVLLLLEPALNPLWAWLIHGEHPGPWSTAGGLLILGATGLKTWLDSRFPHT